MSWTVYTCFDKTDELLYVGITTRPVDRMWDHAYNAPWFSQVTKVLRVEFPTERDARDAEYSIIAAENPPNNARGTDICPRCRTNLRADRTKVYCHPCRRAYNTERRRRLGMRPQLGPTITCPRCEGVKEPGRSYCKTCKSQINAAYRAAR